MAETAIIHGELPCPGCGVARLNECYRDPCPTCGQPGFKGELLISGIGGGGGTGLFSLVFASTLFVAIAIGLVVVDTAQSLQKERVVLLLVLGMVEALVGIWVLSSFVRWVRAPRPKRRAARTCVVWEVTPDGVTVRGFGDEPRVVPKTAIIAISKTSEFSKVTIVALRTEPIHANTRSFRLSDSGGRTGEGIGIVGEPEERERCMRLLEQVIGIRVTAPVSAR